MNTKIKNLLLITVQRNASDLHISPGRFPTIRIDGELIPLVDQGLQSAKEAQELLFSLLDPPQQNHLNEEKELDFSFSLADEARFRSNLYMQNGGWAGAFRVIPQKIRTSDELNLPPILHEFTKQRQGFILVVGPAGSGKSTTLAALIDEINHGRSTHIITIEEPIEYTFTSDLSIINQREVPRDSLKWERALRASLRQDPDVMMIGEMRDPETIAIALTASETGHLVFATLHTNSASQTIDRIIDVFPPGQQNQIRYQLASSLVGIVSQRLIPRVKGGRIPACEVLIATPAVRNLIREGHIYQIELVIETSLQEGMIPLDRSLATLVEAGEITPEKAFEYSLKPEALKNLIGEK